MMKGACATVWYRYAGPLPSEKATAREFFFDKLLFRIHCIIVMSRWTGLAPWKFEFPFVWTGGVQGGHVGVLKSFCRS